MRIPRAAFRLTVLSAIVGGTLVAPTVTPAWATPHPVEPDTMLTDVRLVGEQMVTEQADFSMIGLNLPEDGSLTAEQVQVRTRGHSGAWSAWQSLEATDSGPNDGTHDAAHARRHATEPLWVGSSSAAQVRLTPGSSASAETVKLILIDPNTSRADGMPTSPAGSAFAASAMPRIITRAEWGADENLRTFNAGCGTPSYSSTIEAGILHHTVNSNSYSSVAEAMAMIRADYAYHVQGNGWCDIGYNFLVDKWGNIYEGRAGGVDRAVLGAHAGGFNTNTFGVAMLGDFQTTAPTAAMTAGVTAIMGWKLSLYGRQPLGKVVLTSSGGGTAKFPAGMQAELPVVMGHRDVGNTACPGNAGYATLSAVRQGAAQVGGNQHLVQALYKDMLDRHPSDTEIGAWTSAIARAGTTAVAVSGFSNSEEYRRQRLGDYYLTYLGRSADEGGVLGWLRLLSSGTVTLDTIPRTFMLSDEFYRQGGSTDTGFVTLLYRRQFERTASPSEVAYWAGIIRTSGRAAAVAGIFDSTESGLGRVDAAYRLWLRRPASASEQSSWLRVVITGGDQSMRESLLMSTEYYLQAQGRFQ